MPSGEATAVLLEQGCLPFKGLGDPGISVPVESEEGSGLVAEFRRSRRLTPHQHTSLTERGYNDVYTLSHTETSRFSTT
ncbi:hypothetical protein SAMN05444162_1835 [Paenibacillaceae bacterium GAS479]|nr:hypothetical protein SAMN05444162_1835 [Paenibacillaceae bacterium GAS479]